MSQESPEELLFPEQQTKQEDKDILNYNKAKEIALRGGVGIFSVTRDSDGQALELIAFVCDKDNDLVEIHCSKSKDSNGYTITNYMFLNTVDEEKVMSWTPRMIRKDTAANMKRTFAAIFSSKN